MNSMSYGYFNDLSDTEMYYVDGGWSWATTVDVAVAFGCVALGFAGPAGAVLGACISVGYAIGRGF